MASPIRPILTVTLNPALDLSARVGQMQAGPKLRLSDTRYEPGGGGVNVARAIGRLGGAVTAWVALGGANGEKLLALLQAQGIRVESFAGPGETRQSWAITDDNAQQFRLQLPGMDWDAAIGAQALADILSHAQDLVVLSGSQPPGLNADFPQKLCTELGPGRLVIDTSGAALEKLVRDPQSAARVFVLRLDQAEAEGLAGHALDSVTDTADFAKTLVAMGVAELVCLARGADGSVLVGHDTTHHSRPPQVRIASRVGAGDSFVGAFTLAIARGETPAQALRFGTAAAAAAVMTEGTELCRAEDVERLLPECSLAVI